MAFKYDIITEIIVYWRYCTIMGYLEPDDGCVQ